MVSDAKKKRDAAKKAKAGGSKAGSTKESPAVSTSAVRLQAHWRHMLDDDVAACCVRSSPVL